MSDDRFATLLLSEERSAKYARGLSREGSASRATSAETVK